MGTKAAQKKTLSTLHHNTILNPDPDPNTHPKSLTPVVKKIEDISQRVHFWPDIKTFVLSWVTRATPPPRPHRSAPAIATMSEPCLYPYP